MKFAESVTKPRDSELKGFVTSYENRKSFQSLLKKVEEQFNSRKEAPELATNFSKVYKQIDYENSKLKEGIENYSF